MAIILDAGESLRFDLSGVPSTPWSYSISYDQRGNQGGGEKSAVGTIAIGTPIEGLAAPDGFVIRQQSVSLISIVNLGNAALTLQVQKWDGTTATIVEQVVVQVGATYKSQPDAVVSSDVIQEMAVTYSAADIVALGASTTGELALGSLPPGAIPMGASVANLGTIAASLTTLTASVGTTAGSFVDLHAAGDVHAADGGEAGPTLEGFVYPAVLTPVLVQFTGNANLSTLTGLDDGVKVVLKYMIPSV